MITSQVLVSIRPPILRPPLPSLQALTLKPKLNQWRKNRRSFKCKAEFSQDAPFAIAIGACMLNSLFFPVSNGPPDEEDNGSAINTTDARLAVMGIISFIPYFNWLSWIFAWLDTGSQRTNLSLSPEESWLPIASIVLCIIHIQLEASIRNGDLQGFQIFNELTKKKNVHFQGHRGFSRKEKKKVEKMELPSAQNQSRDELRGWEVRKNQSDELENLNEDEDGKNRRKH